MVPSVHLAAGGSSALCESECAFHSARNHPANLLLRALVQSSPNQVLTSTQPDLITLLTFLRTLSAAASLKTVHTPQTAPVTPRLGQTVDCFESTL